MTKENMPEWAKNLKEWGEGMERKYGGHSHSNDKEADSSQPASNNKRCRPKDTRPEWEKRYNPVGDIVGQFISYLIITYIPIYFPGFFLTGWSAVYTVLIYSIIVHVVVDLFLVILRAKPFYYLGQVITNIATIVATVTMVTLFPFNFPGTVGSIVQFALWIVIVILSIVTFFDFLKIFSPEC